ncbi:MAG: SPOR domain-containing protein, partial [Lachnospiraceae bacterium]|nr:SPOR domain-containing protein [Lachnospiraceae bacterium]
DTAASQPFYGIWVLGSHDPDECRAMVSQLQGQGFTGAAVFYTTDWSNLNTEPWYVVTAGIYGTGEEADAALPGVQAAGYADAYVKYSGERQAHDFAG